MLGSNFLVREPGGNQYAPGVTAVLDVPGAPPTAPPTVVVAGDGDQRAYVLAAPASGGAYVQTQFWDCVGMTGGLVAGDVDGDATTTELFLACYDSGRVEAFSVSA